MPHKSKMGKPYPPSKGHPAGKGKKIGKKKR